MKINGTPYRSVWVDAEDGWSVRILDQTRLPWHVEILRLADEDAVAHAIRSMQLRGAPLIGAAAAHGVALALRRDPSAANLRRVVAMPGRLAAERAARRRLQACEAFAVRHGRAGREEDERRHGKRLHRRPAWTWPACAEGVARSAAARAAKSSARLYPSRAVGAPTRPAAASGLAGWSSARTIGLASTQAASARAAPSAAQRSFAIALPSAQDAECALHSALAMARNVAGEFDVAVAAEFPDELLRLAG